MVTYHPLITTARFRATDTALSDLNWTPKGVTVIFSTADGYRCKVTSYPRVLRVTDEMTVSTEEDVAIDGLVRDHFAYIVQGSRFWDSQSEVMKAVYPDLRHYRFITDDTCLDIIADETPLVTLIDGPPPE